nr:hypothetical protein [Tanacetum cinerariifolium]
MCCFILLEKKKKLRVSGLKRLRKVGTAQSIESSIDTVTDDHEDASKQGEIISKIDVDEDVILEEVDAEKDDKVVTKDDDVEEPAELQKVIKVVTTTKLMTEVVSAATTTITAAAPKAARRRKGVVIRDPEKTAAPSIIIHTEPKSKDKGKGIIVEEPKPLKKQAQIEQDKAYARETLIEAARTMLADLLLPIPFWVEAVNTACYVQNRVLVTKPLNKTPYELLLGRTPSIGFMRPFGCPVTILNTLDPLGSGPTWLFDLDTLTKSMNYQPVIAGNQSNPSAGVQEQFDAEKAEEENVQQYVLFPLWSSGSKDPQNTDGDATLNSAKTKKHDDKTKREAKGRSPVELSTRYRNLSAEFEDFSDNSINEVNAASTPVPTVSPTLGESSYVDPSQYPDDPNMPDLEDITYSDDEEDVGVEADFTNLETTITVSPIPIARVHKDHPVTQIIGDLSSANQTRKPKRVHHTLKDPSWIEAMRKELLQFKMQKVWVLVDLPNGKRAIGHTQEEGINYEEVFTPVARIEAIRLFLAYASFMGFMVYQMDVKSAFLYETIKEEVYVCQPLGFKDPDYLDKVYKVVKALYGLHQPPRAWYETLVNYLLENGFQKGKIDQTLFIKKQKDGKSSSTPIDTKKPLLKDPDGKDVDVHTYRYARSRPNDKMIVDSIENGPYVRRMITTLGEPDLPVPLPKSFHEQTNEELTETNIKWMDADDQAIQTILLGLLEDIYAVVDSCETAKEI